MPWSLVVRGRASPHQPHRIPVLLPFLRGHRDRANASGEVRPELRVKGTGDSSSIRDRAEAPRDPECEERNVHTRFGVSAWVHRRRDRRSVSEFHKVLQRLRFRSCASARLYRCFVGGVIDQSRCITGGHGVVFRKLPPRPREAGFRLQGPSEPVGLACFLFVGADRESWIRKGGTRYRPRTACG